MKAESRGQKSTRKPLYQWKEVTPIFETAKLSVDSLKYSFSNIDRTETKNWQLDVLPPSHSNCRCVSIKLSRDKLGENHGADRLKAACEAALAVENHTYGYLKDWLKTQAGQKAESEVNGKESIPAHENIRGSAAYRDHGIGTTTEQ